MDATTARLIDVAADSGRMLSPDAVSSCKRSLVDAFAGAFGAYNDPLCDMSRVLARRYSGSSPSATVLGCNWTTSVDAAAFANGVLIRVEDSNDSYLAQSRGHPSDMMSAILAVGQATQASGLAVIEAINIAYEVFCSFCDSIDINSMGWDQPIYVGLGSALGSARLLKLDREQTAHALALALVPNMALRQTRDGELSSWKGCAAANAARNAVFAAYLAKDGFSGPPAPFEGKAGLWDIVGEFEWKVPNSGPAKVTQTHMKCFPVAYHGQPAAWAAVDMRNKLSPQGIGKIASLRADTYHQAIAVMASDPSHWAPANQETADHSLPYVIALGLLDGNINSESFEIERITRSDAVALMKKIDVKEDADLSGRYPAELPCRLRATLQDGTVVESSVSYPKGHVNSPLSNAEIETKFTDLFKEYGKQVQARAILDMLWNLESAADINELFRACTKQG